MRNTKKNKIRQVLTNNPNKFYTYKELQELLGFQIQTIRSACNRLTNPPNSLFNVSSTEEKMKKYLCNKLLRILTGGIVGVNKLNY